MNDDTRDTQDEAEQDRALDRLTAEWPDYEIYLVDDQWQAWHKGAPLEDMLDGATPDELNAKIAADARKRSAP